ncbi:hypothetical protein CTAM01_07316 [Colletotrichum tamarilloi]|uniref:Uncharacterized protein n=1 Tax=Colletotrichum tamarilloi TaxID=1209934 RepID=A0ABQ9R9H4_9PEZI|nr:uncharacterized protein CTAM01_07316 [Colletotrichum tamarilloi]KAK1498587.1 hypothetical protein CTAM01_07316 [Colletotrichum tamarilloi]
MERVVRSNKRAEVGQCDKSKREANISRECGPKGAGVCFQSRSRGRILEVLGKREDESKWNATPYAASSSTLARVSGTAACGGHSEARRMTPAGCSGMSGTACSAPTLRARDFQPSHERSWGRSL